MKTITIGRGDGADIIIDDEMISRRHAILRIYSSGKMELVDMGKNGTFVNGVKLRPNVPFPVKRKDVVSFAEVSKLDWKMVPDNSRYYKIAAIIAAVIIGLLILFGIGSYCYKAFVAEPSTPSYNIDENEQAAPSSSQDGSEMSVDKAKEEKAKQGQKGQNDKDAKKKENDNSGKSVQELFPSQPKKNEPAKNDGNKGKNGKGAQKSGDQNTENNSDGVIM